MARPRAAAPFLVPMIDLMESVGLDKRVESQQAYDKLKDHLGAYATYFQ